MCWSEMLARRLSRVEESATMKMGHLARQLEAESQGEGERKVKRVLNFSLGEPDFKTPKHICEAAKKALDAGETHYTSGAGIEELRAEIAAKMRAENGVEAEVKNVLVTPGAKQAIYELMMAVLDDGDEVVLLDPSWVSFESAVKLAGGVPKWVRRLGAAGEGEGEDGGEGGVSYESLASAASEKTKLLVLNSPNNPVGYVLSERELREVAEFAVEHDIIVLSDEIYERIIYDGRRHVSVASFDGMQERTVVINGFSKTYAMTGWRVGYAVAPPEIVGGMLKIQQHSVTCAPSVSQFAALAGLQGSQECVAEMVAEFKRRRDVIVKRLNAGAVGLRCLNPEGAFYAFVNVNGDGEEFTERLLKEARVVVTPGSAFGEAGRGFVRFSYAAAMEDILEGLERLESII